MKYNKNNPLLRIQKFGQSIWLDLIRRGMLDSGELKGMIERDGLQGVTSNPAIFEKSIDDSHDYDNAIRKLVRDGKSVEQIYSTLTVEDVQHAADLFSTVYKQTDHLDGYVSLEVSPHLSHNTEGTIIEARRLWGELNRPNVLIKVPATLEGLPAIQQLISEGINVNVTLLFGLPRYRQVAEAYIAGLETRTAQGKPVKNIASVASFFLSRIDTLVDPLLEKLMEPANKKTEIAKKVHGQIAISSAKAAYQIYKEIFYSNRFKKLVDKGARAQRLLWASTSTKNPDYKDVKYIEQLIGADTVNTVPLETLDAYRDHGNPKPCLEQEVKEAFQMLEQLPELGISIGNLTQQLEDEGVKKFEEPFNKLMRTLTKKSSEELKKE
jgi:transaldolase